MKYFTKEACDRYSSAYGDGVTQEEREKREQEFHQLVERYHDHLEQLRSRISKSAFEFFRFGFAETGLHDASLISMNMGCGLDFVVDGTKEFDVNKRRSDCVIQLLNFDQTYLHTFTLRGVSLVNINAKMFSYGNTYSWGDLDVYELVLHDEKHLQFAFRFSGFWQDDSEVRFVFKRLVYKRKRIYPKWERRRRIIAVYSDDEFECDDA